MFEWIKKHKILLICLGVSSVIVVPLVIHILFKIHPKNSFFSAEWTAGELLGYYGAVLSFVGTVVLGALALYQNKLIKDESDRHEQLLISQEHERNMPKFTVKSQGSNGNCANLEISINNVSENIATNISISNAKIILPDQTEYWKLKKPLHFDIIAPINHIKAKFDNPTIQQDGTQYMIWMQCDDKYNKTHYYKISGVYFTKDYFPKFEIEETTD